MARLRRAASLSTCRSRGRVPLGLAAPFRGFKIPVPPRVERAAIGAVIAEVEAPNIWGAQALSFCSLTLHAPPLRHARGAPGAAPQDAEALHALLEGFPRLHHPARHCMHATLRPPVCLPLPLPRVCGGLLTTCTLECSQRITRARLRKDCNTLDVQALPAVHMLAICGVSRAFPRSRLSASTRCATHIHVPRPAEAALHAHGAPPAAARDAAAQRAAALGLRLVLALATFRPDEALLDILNPLSATVDAVTTFLSIARFPGLESIDLKLGAYVHLHLVVAAIW
ncbi:hypothetical protein B0H15DRAFT_955807 [Mycena belliarum]|uniref:Uncharacterized protein n=1 Tax=Mycena belliarum TaxID=1033014 RepID=A0AAD6TSH5_9AGAR|nr:hypothetical protein B0H15DRAFT_955807 [Mycena belliae]